MESRLFWVTPAPLAMTAPLALVIVALPLSAVFAPVIAPLLTTAPVPVASTWLAMVPVAWLVSVPPLSTAIWLPVTVPALVTLDASGA